DSPKAKAPTLGSGGSLGNDCVNHLAHSFHSPSHSPGSAPKLRPLHARNSSIACHFSLGLVKVGVARMAARKGRGASGLGLTLDARSAVSTSARSSGFLLVRPRTSSGQLSAAGVPRALRSTTSSTLWRSSPTRGAFVSGGSLP